MRSGQRRVRHSSARRSTGPAKAVPALAPLRVPAYRRVWCAMTVSHLGTYLQLTAAPWLMLELTGSPLLVSLVTTALFLPRLVLTLPAGALADLVDRRMLMLVGQGISCASAAALAVLVHLDHLTPSALLSLTFVLGAGSAVDKPAYQTLVPDLVPLPLRAQAITLNSAAHQAARIVGPSIGGLLVAVGVTEGAFGGNAVSFALVMAVLLTVPRDSGTATVDRGGDVSRRMRQGVRFVRAHPGLQRLLFVTAAFALTAASVQALLPSLVSDELGLGAGSFGALYGIFGAGALAATVTRERVAVVAGAMLLPGAIMTFGAAGIVLGSTRHVVVAGTAVAVIGLAWVWTMTTLNATVQLLSPRWVRGRVISLYVLAVAMKPVGAFLVGALAERVGAGGAVLWSSVATVLVALVAVRARLPVLGDHEAARGSEVDGRPERRDGDRRQPRTPTTSADTGPAEAGSGVPDHQPPPP